MQKALVALVAEPEAAAAVSNASRIIMSRSPARIWLRAVKPPGWPTTTRGATAPICARTVAAVDPAADGAGIAVYWEAGVPVFFHTCGRAEAFVGDLLDAGVTVFNLQSEACDLTALREHYGRRSRSSAASPAG